MEQQCYFFSFDSIKILGGFKNNVHVEATEITGDEECILSIERSMFMDMVKQWLDIKIDYCDRFKHYCGVGDILCSAEELYNTTVYEYEEDEDDNIIVNKIEKKVYQATNFEIDMEHG